MIPRPCVLCALICAFAVSCAKVGSGGAPTSPTARALASSQAALWSARGEDLGGQAARHWLVTLTLDGNTLRLVDVRPVPGRAQVRRADDTSWRVVLETAAGTPVAAVAIPAPAPLRAELARPDGTVDAYRFDASPRTFKVRLPEDPTGQTLRVFEPGRTGLQERAHLTIGAQP